MKENTILFHDLPLLISSISYSYYSVKITASAKNESKLLKYLKKIIEENSLVIVDEESLNEDSSIEITKDYITRIVKDGNIKYSILISGIMLEIFVIN